MRSSIPLYDALAADYDGHFAAPHRRAYDDLSWDAVLELLAPPRPGHVVVDAGCGVGRWAGRLVQAGHEVVGIEQSPKMLDGARARALGDRFTLVEGSMEHAELPAGSAAAVVAMGSLQYTEDPTETLARFATWGAPGAPVAVLVDGRVALVAELASAGRDDEAEQRRTSRRGVWSADGHDADLHLFDAAQLTGALTAAGLVDVEVRGLLCGWTVLGRDRLLADLRDRWDVALGREARWSTDPSMADLGKQLLGIGRVPG